VIRNRSNPNPTPEQIRQSLIDLKEANQRLEEKQRRNPICYTVFLRTDGSISHLPTTPPENPLDNIYDLGLD
jgi:hypothetical protein